MGTYFEVIFDNGGGTTLQVDAPEFTIYYENPEWAARDISGLLAGGTTAGWEGNCPEARYPEYDPDMQSNGGYRWWTRPEIEAVVASAEIRTGWRNEMEFFVALGCSDLG